MSTLHEADEYIAGRLRSAGLDPEKKVVPVQAFVPDTSQAHGFRKPASDEPWYDATNLIAKKRGFHKPDDLIVLIAHKDTQSWLGCAAGAHDNAVGVAALLSMAHALKNVSLNRTLWFVFCNEEHWPWTSVQIAGDIASSDYNTVAVFNVDGIGGKSADSLKNCEMVNVTRYTTPEGERIADLLISLNSIYDIGLKQSKYAYDRANDDDGSFINAGIPAAVMNIGTFPYAEPNYHTRNDIPENVDVKNVQMSAQLILCGTLHIDVNGLQ
jgi:Zn-dependent M28 family amino/carboxypeptidase